LVFEIFFFARGNSKFHSQNASLCGITDTVESNVLQENDFAYQSLASTALIKTFETMAVLFPSLGQMHLHLTSSY